MPRLAFRNPPVHEVIFTLQIRGRVDLKDLEGAGKLLSEPELTSERERVESHQVELVGTPSGEAGARVRRDVTGWAFKAPGPTKIVQARRDALSVHTIRPGSWPVGSYPGWDAHSPWALNVFRELAPIYSGFEPRRASLRYLNRIAVPDQTDPREWFTIIPIPPRGLSEVSVFQVGQTWEHVEDHDDLSVTVRLMKIAIDDSVLQEGHQGALLDIDVFTRNGETAPSFEALPEWFSAAHAVENAVFESCITAQLSERFGRM